MVGLFLLMGKELLHHGDQHNSLVLQLAMCAYSGSAWNEDGERGKKKNWLLVLRKIFRNPALILVFTVTNINRGDIHGYLD